MNNTKTIHTLICHSHVQIGIICLGSLITHSQTPLSLRIHDDGTLTESDIEQLKASLPNVTLVLRRDADIAMGELLRHKPASAHYRLQHPLGLKLLDLMYLAESDVVFYADSDVLFLRNFDNIFCLPDETTGAVFMSDVLSFYSLTKLDTLNPFRIALPQNTNTGLFTMKKSAYDVDLIEWFLSQKRYNNNQFWREQTCLAMLGDRASCRLYDPRQITVVTPQSRITTQLVAAHFVSNCRHLLPLWNESTKFQPDDPVVTVSTVAAHRFGTMAAAGELFNRAIKKIYRH